MDNYIILDKFCAVENFWLDYRMSWHQKDLATKADVLWLEYIFVYI